MSQQGEPKQGNKIYKNLYDDKDTISLDEAKEIIVDFYNKNPTIKGIENGLASDMKHQKRREKTYYCNTGDSIDRRGLKPGKCERGPWEKDPREYDLLYVDSFPEGEQIQHLANPSKQLISSGATWIRPVDEIDPNDPRIERHVIDGEEKFSHPDVFGPRLTQKSQKGMHTGNADLVGEPGLLYTKHGKRWYNHHMEKRKWAQVINDERKELGLPPVKFEENPNLIDVRWCRKFPKTCGKKKKKQKLIRSPSPSPSASSSSSRSHDDQDDDDDDNDDSNTLIDTSMQTEEKVTDSSDGSMQTEEEVTDSSNASMQTEEEEVTDSSDASMQTEEEEVTDSSDASMQTEEKEVTDSSDGSMQTEEEVTDSSDASTQAETDSSDASMQAVTDSSDASMQTEETQPMSKKRKIDHTHAQTEPNPIAIRPPAGDEKQTQIPTGSDVDDSSSGSDDDTEVKREARKIAKSAFSPFNKSQRSDKESDPIDSPRTDVPEVKALLREQIFDRLEQLSEHDMEELQKDLDKQIKKKIEKKKEHKQKIDKLKKSHEEHTQQLQDVQASLESHDSDKVISEPSEVQILTDPIHGAQKLKQHLLEGKKDERWNKKPYMDDSSDSGESDKKPHMDDSSDSGESDSDKQHSHNESLLLLKTHPHLLKKAEAEKEVKQEAKDKTKVKDEAEEKADEAEVKADEAEVKGDEADEADEADEQKEKEDKQEVSFYDEEISMEILKNATEEGLKRLKADENINIDIIEDENEKDWYVEDYTDPEKSWVWSGADQSTLVESSGIDYVRTYKERAPPAAEHPQYLHNIVIGKMVYKDKKQIDGQGRVIFGSEYKDQEVSPNRWSSTGNST